MAKKFKSGDCVDHRDINEVGEIFWSNAWRVDKNLGKGTYRILYARGSEYDGTVTWANSKYMRKSTRCRRTLSEARAQRRR